MRSAAAFQLKTIPRVVLLMIASLDDLTIAARCPLATCSAVSLECFFIAISGAIRTKKASLHMEMNAHHTRSSQRVEFWINEEDGSQGIIIY